MASTTPLGSLGSSRPSVQTPTHGGEVPSTPALPCDFQGGVAPSHGYIPSFSSPTFGPRAERVSSAASTLDLDASSSDAKVSNNTVVTGDALASTGAASAAAGGAVDATTGGAGAPLSPGAALTAPSEDLGTFTFAGQVDTTHSPPCYVRTTPKSVVPMLSREDLESVDVLVSLMLLGRGGARPVDHSHHHYQHQHQQPPTVMTAPKKARGPSVVPTASAGAPVKKRKVGRPLGSYRRERATIDEEEDMPPLVVKAAKATAKRIAKEKVDKPAKQPKRPRASSTASSQGAVTKRRRASSTGSTGGPRLHSVATRLGYCACRECTKKIEPTQQRLAYCGSRCQVREQNLRQRRVKNCNSSLVQAKDSLLESLIAASPDRHGLEAMLEMERAERACV